MADQVVLCGLMEVVYTFCETNPVSYCFVRVTGLFGSSGDSVSRFNFGGGGEGRLKLLWMLGQVF